ncbi:hypothetical protein I79_000371 [Cricetulus griseus]|uniref:Uncharacterized protein n=1 Tax=Cricetulus griseus TaxID=10029 RepID=G3GS59_CRIGR|nr:hypothetical protein I79_000371 [Cricetulus griseus]
MTKDQFNKSFFYVYITCFGIQVENCPRKAVEKCLYSQYEQETRIKGKEAPFVGFGSRKKRQRSRLP